MVLKEVYKAQELFFETTSNIFLSFYSVIDVLLAVLLFTILFYPYFVCLTTEYKFVGSILGFLYGVLRYVCEYFLKLWDFFCSSSLSQT